jgi:hypothetical protein
MFSLFDNPRVLTPSPQTRTVSLDTYLTLSAHARARARLWSLSILPVCFCCLRV